MDRGAWTGIVRGVAKPQTQLKQLSLERFRSESHTSLLTLCPLDLSIPYQTHTEARMIPNLHLMNICYIS